MLKETTLKGDPEVPLPRASPLKTYRKRVLDASTAASGNPNAYLVEMVETRFRAIRSGVCEPSDLTTPWPDLTKDRSVCEEPVQGAKNVLILGDSIASDTYGWLRSAYPELNIIQRTGIGCNLQRFEKDLPKPCIWILEDAKRIALSSKVKMDAVVLTSLWGVLSTAQLNATAAGPLIDSLLANGRKIIIVGPPVGFTAPARDLPDKCPSTSKEGLTDLELEQCAREHSTVHRAYNKAMKQFAEEKGILFVDLHELVCNDSTCPVLDDEGHLMYTDSWHRTFPGNVFVAGKVRKSRVVDSILGRP